jgi:hypothetical protein
MDSGPAPSGASTMCNCTSGNDECGFNRNVIPGRREASSPESITTIGFRACAKWRIPDVQLHIGE